MKKLLLIVLVGAFAGTVFAETEEEKTPWTPVQVNLASPLGILWGDCDVTGLRLNIFYGHSLNFAGLDLGMVGTTRGDACGLQMNVYNHVEGFFGGVQLAPFANYTVKKNNGVQIAGLLNWGLDDGAGFQFAPFNFNGAYTGVQLGCVNWDSGLNCGFTAGLFNIADADLVGYQLAALNFSYGNLTGCQFGVFNMAFGHSKGLQFGLFNAAEEHTGVQIGLININANAQIPLMAILNVNFR